MVAVQLRKSVSKPENTANDIITEILKLFQSHHSYTENRFQSTCFWVGIEELERGEICEEVLRSRLSFLQKMWTNKQFRPFDSVKDSENHLRENNTAGFILRLSTSQPGKITYTRRMNEKIVHTRFTLNPDGSLYDQPGNIFKNIDSLVERIICTLGRRSKYYMPAECVPQN